ncbi:MAG: ABC transporter permease subunit [Candidatus Latescibacteria bacterium]|jgi:ABC-type transport system involved in multi-copper enzyme maturation permease subunit|nr:ABC transporter permease subunit [Candidatus Latescibacterota bacterium]
MKHIVIRELMNSIFKLRFLLLGSILVLLFAFSSMAFLADYGNKIEEYESPQQLLNKQLSDTRKPDGILGLHIFVQRPINILREPHQLSFCVNGNDDTLPNYFSVDNKNYQYVNSAIKRKDQNPWVKTFGTLDWVYMIGIIGSFMAITLSYDAFTGDKEEGTLRLLLSNSIPRYKLLLGKFFGIFLTLIIPLMIGYLISLIIINLSNIVSIGISDFPQILLIIILSLIYLSVFIFIGLFVSSMSHNSSASLIILLFMWIVYTLIIPGSSTIFARTVYKIPRNEEIVKQSWESYNDVMKTMSGSNRAKFSKTERARNQYEAYRVRGEVSDRYRRKKFAQLDIARLFSRFSPQGPFKFAAEALAGVGIPRQKSLIEQLKIYKNSLADFILSEERRISDNPNGILHFNTLPQEPFNMEAIPVFKEKPMTVREGLRSSLPDVGLLVLYGIVFFAAAFVSFNRYDVR